MQVDEECPIGDRRDVDRQWDQDARNPFNWARWKKCMVLCISCTVTFFAGMNSTAITTAGEAISIEFHVDNGIFEYNYFAVTAWNGAAGIVPLATLPIMETYGMRVGYLVSHLALRTGTATDSPDRLHALHHLPDPPSLGQEFRNTGSLPSHRRSRGWHPAECR